MIPTAIITFFKEKIFNLSGIFLTIFAVIIGLFIFSNSNVILSKFGFETTTNLKSQVTSLQKDLDNLKQINDDLNKTVSTLEKSNNEKEKALVDYFKEREVLKDNVTKLTKKRTEEIREINSKIKDKIIETPESITLPKKEYQEQSLSNISLINNVFNSNFTPEEIQNE